MADAPSVRNARIFAFGFDLTTPIFNELFAAAAGLSIEAGVFLPLENDGLARDFTLYKPLQASYERILKCLKEKNISFKREYLTEDFTEEERETLSSMMQRMRARAVAYAEGGVQP